MVLCAISRISENGEGVRVPIQNMSLSAIKYTVIETDPLLIPVIDSAVIKNLCGCKWTTFPCHSFGLVLHLPVIIRCL